MDNIVGDMANLPIPDRSGVQSGCMCVELPGGGLDRQSDVDGG
jgi:hypothetical protein